MTEVITVLVAGHGAPPELEPVALDRRLGDVISAIKEVAGPANHLRILTGISTGAEQAAAELARAQALPLSLLAPGNPQPLSPSQQAAERIVWMGAIDSQRHAGDPRAIRDQVAVAFADLLVVLWDGEVRAGQANGVAGLILEAARLMRPVVWVNTRGELRLLDRPRLTLATLNLLRSPQPQAGLLRHLFSAAMSDEAMKQALAEEVSTLLPAVPQTSLPVDDGAAMGQVMELRRVESSRAARRAGGLHRRFIWMSYGASACAVFAAVAGAIHLWPGAHNQFWSVVELVLIAGIIAAVVLARARDWHGQWIRQRFIAEQLRSAKLAVPMLCLPQHFIRPMWVSRQGKLELLSHEQLLLHRILIQEGLPHNAGEQAYCPNSPENQVRHLAVLKDTLAEQYAYHSRKHHRTHRLQERLHGLSLALFTLTLVAVLLHFVLHDAWLLIFTAFFPALAGALHGLSAKLEIGRIAGQSQAAAVELEALGVAIEDVTVDHSWEGWLRMRELTLAVAHVMSAENAQWQELISHQQAELPA